MGHITLLMKVWEKAVLRGKVGNPESGRSRGKATTMMRGWVREGEVADNAGSEGCLTSQ